MAYPQIPVCASGWLAFAGVGGSQVTWLRGVGGELFEVVYVGEQVRVGDAS